MDANLVVKEEPIQSFLLNVIVSSKCYFEMAVIKRLIRRLDCH